MIMFGIRGSDNFAKFFNKMEMLIFGEASGININKYL